MNKTARMPFGEQILAILALVSKNHGIENFFYDNIFYGIHYLTEKYPESFSNIYFCYLNRGYPYSSALEEALFRLGVWEGVCLTGYGLQYIVVDSDIIEKIEEDTKSQYGEKILAELTEMAKDFADFIKNEICTQKSVGIIIWKENDILLVERKKFPFGFALPAGHVDESESFEEAAARELKEETGLEAVKLTFLTEGMKENNSCRRKKGDKGHYWKVYLANNYKGELKLNISETKNIRWHSFLELHKLAFRTVDYLQGKITEEEWEKSPGIEVVWYEWLQHLDVFDLDILNSI